MGDADPPPISSPTSTHGAPATMEAEFRPLATMPKDAQQQKWRHWECLAELTATRSRAAIELKSTATVVRGSIRRRPTVGPMRTRRIQKWGSDAEVCICATVTQCPWGCTKKGQLRIRCTFHPRGRQSDSESQRCEERFGAFSGPASSTQLHVKKLCQKQQHCGKPLGETGKRPASCKHRASTVQRHFGCNPLISKDRAARAVRRAPPMRVLFIFMDRRKGQSPGGEGLYPYYYI